MCNADHEIQNLIAIQGDIFRIAKSKYALSPKRLSALSGISDATIASWANGTAMPAHGLVRLAAFLPDELTSLLFEPAGKHVGTNKQGDGDFDDLNCHTTEYSAYLAKAKHPKSPGGPNLAPVERATLRDIARRGEPVMRAVAAA